jgi:hypothetical protein
MHQGAVHRADVLGGTVQAVLRDEDQTLLVTPVFGQALEGLAHTALTVAAADFLDTVELGEVLVDQDLAHWGVTIANAKRGPLGYLAAESPTVDNTRIRDTMKLLALALLPLPLALTLTACSTPAPTAPPGSANSVTQVATTPLSDLNLVRAEIPPVLALAQRGPYALPAERSCEALGKDIQALDAVLGADLDTPVTAANPSLVDRGSDAATGALRSAAAGVIPYRGWVRKLSGAERYAKEVAAAIAAGTIRRAYLKGLGQAANCVAPAAPRN